MKRIKVSPQCVIDLDSVACTLYYPVGVYDDLGILTEERLEISLHGGKFVVLTGKTAVTLWNLIEGSSMVVYSSKEEGK